MLKSISISRLNRGGPPSSLAKAPSLAIAIIFLLFPYSLHSQWSTDPANSLIVGYGLLPEVCSDSAGGGIHNVRSLFDLSAPHCVAPIESLWLSAMGHLDCNSRREARKPLRKPCARRSQWCYDCVPRPRRVSAPAFLPVFHPIASATGRQLGKSTVGSEWHPSFHGRAQPE